MTNGARCRARGLRVGLYGAVLLGTSLIATQALAGGAVRLEWERSPGAPSCISEGELVAAVESALGRAVFTGATGAIILSGRVSRVSAGFSAEVTVRERGRETERRSVQVGGSDCRKLDEALVVVIAVALEPRLGAMTAPEPVATRAESVAASSVAASSVATSSVATSSVATSSGSAGGAEGGEAAVTAPSAAPATVQTSRKVEPRRASTPSGRHKEDESAREAKPDAVAPAPSGDRAGVPESGARAAAGTGFAIAGGAGVAFGLMPGPATFFDGSFAWRLHRQIALEAGVEYFPFGKKPTDGGDADFRATLGALRACAAFPSRFVRFELCPETQAGVIAAEGVAFPIVASRTRFYAAVGAAARAEMFVARPFFVRVAARADVPLVHDVFVVDRTGASALEVHRVAAVVPMAQLQGGFALE